VRFRFGCTKRPCPIQVKPLVMVWAGRFQYIRPYTDVYVCCFKRWQIGRWLSGRSYRPSLKRCSIRLRFLAVVDPGMSKVRAGSTSKRSSIKKLTGGAGRRWTASQLEMLTSLSSDATMTWRRLRCATPSCETSTTA
jgi:hypothetical protein